MARQIEGVYERVLLCAKNEFLEKGFIDASLRKIAREANTSTSSIYTRFQDKEGIFNALVTKTINEFRSFFWGQQEYLQNMSDEESEERIALLIEYIYDNFDIFKLLLCCSQGTRHFGLIDILAKIDVEYSINYINSNSDNIFSSLTPEILRMISVAYYSAIFEVVILDMEKEDAYKYIREFRTFFKSGWEGKWR